MPIQRAKPRIVDLDQTPLTGMPAGSVLQVKQGWSDTKETTNTTANIAAPTCPASVTITPSSSSNKILIMFYGSWIFGNGNDIAFFLLRDSTQIGTSTATGHNSRGIIVESMADYADYRPRSSSFQYLDSPSTTSSITYTVKAVGIQGTKSSGGAAVGGGGNNEEWTWGGSVATSGTESNTGTMAMIAMEIKG